MSLFKLNEFEEKLIESIDNLTSTLKKTNKIMKKLKRIQNAI